MAAWHAVTSSFHALEPVCKFGCQNTVSYTEQLVQTRLPQGSLHHIGDVRYASMLLHAACSGADLMALTRMCLVCCSWLRALCRENMTPCSPSQLTMAVAVSKDWMPNETGLYEARQMRAVIMHEDVRHRQSELVMHTGRRKWLMSTRNSTLLGRVCCSSAIAECIRQHAQVLDTA